MSSTSVLKNVPALWGGLVYSSLLKIASKNTNNPIKAELIVSNTNISVMYHLIKRRTLFGRISEAPPILAMGASRRREASPMRRCSQYQCNAYKLNGN